jgi:hypothetical protein
MPGEPELVGLLHRADWTRLRLAAELNDGTSVLIAPGRRYRRQDGARVWGCDGQHPWEPPEDDGDDGGVHGISGPEPPLRALLCPAWLLPGTRLDVLGPVTACGRAAWHVAVTRRPDARFALSWAARGADRADVFVDAELGILLRLAWDADTVPDDDWAGGEEEDDGDELIEGPQVTEMVSLDLDPVVEPGRFAAPPGSRIGESFGQSPFGDGLGGRAAKTAGGLAAGGLAEWLRLSSATAAAPPGEDAETREDAQTKMPAETEIPADDPAPELSADGRPVGPPAPDEVLHLLQASAATDFTATAHEWYDAVARLSRVPAGTRRADFGGLGSLFGVLTERPVVLHRTAALRIGGPGQYQLDRTAERSPEATAAEAGEPRGTREREPTTIACDGQQCWRVYDDHVTAGPAASLTPEFAELTDASWLLECRLAGGELVTADGRPAYRLQVARGDGDRALPLSVSPALAFPAAVAVVDAERGTLVRLTSYAGGKPVRRYDLMGVTAAPGEFRVDLPADRAVADEEPWSAGGRGRGAQPPRNLRADTAGLIGRQFARDAAGAARNILRRLGGR